MRGYGLWSNGEKIHEKKQYQITSRFECVKFLAVDAGDKTPWLEKKILEDEGSPILPM